MKPDSLNTQVGGSHYQSLKIQPAEYIFKNKLPFLEGSAIKYLTRHRDKNKSQDILKAMHFCQMILEMEYGVKVDVIQCEDPQGVGVARREQVDNVRTDISEIYSQRNDDTPDIQSE